MLSYAHRNRPQPSNNQEPERGRSRTPKSTMTIVGHRHLVHKHIPSDPPVQISRSSSQEQRVYRHTRRPLRGKSPDRSNSGALEDAIHEAYARGDLRQCLQWVLEMQGVYLEWDDPRLDTVTEDDLCFSELTGLGPDATPEERRKANEYWAMRQTDDDEALRVWESSATPSEKEAFRRRREQYEAEQRKREARARFFRAPRMDKVGLVAPFAQRPPVKSKPLSTLSHSLDSPLHRPHPIPRTTRSRPKVLFPVDESELSAVRSMWIDQGRKGIGLVEMLVQPPAEPPAPLREVASLPAATPGHDRSDNATASTSASTSLSSAPSALFSSVLTTSTATSVSTAPCSSTPSSPTKSSSPSRTRRAATTAKLTHVSPSESPLHTYLTSVSLRQPLEDETQPQKEFITPSTEHSPYQRLRAVSTDWLSKGSKTVGGLINLVGRLPSAYLPPSEASPLRTVSCPPPTNHPSESEIFIHLLPLRPPSHPLTFPPLPLLPRSPYRPLFPPLQPTPRPRFVPNPQFLRLKALHNRVLWGLVPVPRAECDILADITRRHQGDACPGRPDVDRFGQMFTAKEALLRFAVEGAGLSALSDERRVIVNPAPSVESAWMWSWWPVRV